MVNVSPNGSKLIERIRAITGYKSMSEDVTIKYSYSIKTGKKGKKPKVIFSKGRIEKIRKEFDESRNITK